MGYSFSMWQYPTDERDFPFAVVCVLQIIAAGIGLYLCLQYAGVI